MSIKVVTILAAIVLAMETVPHPAGAHGPTNSRSPRLSESAILERESPTNQHRVVVGLDLRNRDELEQFLADVQNPASPNYGQFLTQEEFNANYAPTAAAEQGVADYLAANGLTVTDRFSNHLLVGAVGSVAALERTFGIELHNVTFKGKAHYAAVNEPTWPADIAGSVVGIIGLDDLSTMHAHVREAQPAAAPNAALGTNCCHLSPNDLAVFYDNGNSPTGTGQTLVIAGAYAWSATDVATFDSQWGLPGLPSGSGQVCTGSRKSYGCQFGSQNSIEISLDVEYAHGTAPNAVILNYMAASTFNSDFITMYNRIVTDNPGHVVTTSWGSCEAGTSTATQQTDDNIFANANAIGQTWFAASGDNGSRDCGNVLTVDHPANSPHVMGVGGTTPTCSSGMISSSPGCGGYGSESGWSGSGGGISQVFGRPAFQTGCSVPSGTQRLVPDVALEADPSPGNYVAAGGIWYSVGGTSDAAPQWAGLFAELNQQVGGNGLGNPGMRLYGSCTRAFHDIRTGSNGDYNAGVGYDLVTGLGSPDAATLLGAPTVCDSADSIPPEGGTLSGTTIGGADMLNPPLGCAYSDNSTAPEKVFTWTPVTSGAWTVETCGSALDTVLYVRSGDCIGGTDVACNDDACGLQSQVTVDAVAGTTYYIIVDGFASNSGPFTLSMRPAPATLTPTVTPTATITPTPTVTPTATDTPTTTPTPLPTNTSTVTPAPTDTPTRSPTPQVFHLAATQDAWIDQSKPSQNKGTDASLRVKAQSGSVRRSLVQFNVSGIPVTGCIQTATLRMTLANVERSSRTYAVHALSAPWAEGAGASSSGVTWQRRMGTAGSEWSVLGGDFSADPTATAATGTTSGAVVQWNVTADVRAFVGGRANNGWIVKDTAESANAEFVFASSENGTAGKRPDLQVTVVPGACP